MINLALSIAAAVFTAALIKLFGFAWVAAIIPAILVFGGVFVLLARRTFSQLQALAIEVQKELQGITTPKEQKIAIEKAIKKLESGLALGRWQFWVESQLHGQVGQLKYVSKDYAGAATSFEKASARDAMSQTMHGALLFQNKDFAKMEKVFEAAVNTQKKESLLWATYAYCLQSTKQSDKALSVLVRAVQANPSDERLKNALTAMQNEKKLKMRAWEPMWWQIGLEAPPMQQAQFVTHGRGGRQRFIRR